MVPSPGLHSTEYCARYGGLCWSLRVPLVTFMDNGAANHLQTLLHRYLMAVQCASIQRIVYSRGGSSAGHRLVLLFAFVCACVCFELYSASGPRNAHGMHMGCAWDGTQQQLTTEVYLSREMGKDPKKGKEIRWRNCGNVVKSMCRKIRTGHDFPQLKRSREDQPLNVRVFI